MDGYHWRLVVSLIVILLVATILACAIGLPDAAVRFFYMRRVADNEEFVY